MKIRNGFVSNSSSSSFVIAINTINKPCDCCGRIDLDFEESCFKWREFRESECLGTGCENIVRLLEDTEETYLDINREQGTILKDKLQKYNNGKWKLMLFSMDYDDVLMKGLLFNILESKNAILLYDEENKYKGKYNENTQWLRK